MKIVKATAIGVLSLSGAAFAQSNVTIYGVIDAAYVYTSGHDAAGKASHFGGVVAGGLAGSRLGFKGEESLGNGLSAIYTLEYAINNDDNSGVGTGATANPGTLARQQFVGLKGGWGALTLGRQYAPGFIATVRNDASGGALWSPQAMLAAFSGSTFVPGNPARINNSVAYKSPNLSGMVFDVIYGYGENVGAGTSRTDDGFIGLGVNYGSGPLNVDLAYQSRQNRVKVGGGRDDINEWFLGASYDFKVAKLFGSYQNLDDKTNPAANADFDILNVGVGVPVGASGVVNLSWAGYRPDKGSNNDSSAWNLGYVHALSKRTKLYTGYTRVSNDAGGVPARMITTSGVLAGNASGTAGDNSTFYAGINHSF